METWKPLGEYPNYEVSDEGNVRRVGAFVERGDGIKRYLPSRNLKPGAGGPHGKYLRVSLWHRGKQSCAYVHRLVAVAFIGPCPKGYEVNHKDGKHANNRTENLEYVTPSQNKQHFYLNNRGLISGENHWNAKLRGVDVSAIRALAAAGFPQTYIGKLFEVHQMTVSKIARGERWREENK